MIMSDNLCVSCGNYAPDENMLCNDCQAGRKPSRNNVMEFNVKINHFSQIRDFVKISTQCPGEVYLVGDNYKVSAKSLMGVYSLNLSNPVRAVFYGGVPNEVLKSMKKFIVEKE